MDYRRIRELFREFAAKLEEQHTFYLDSVVGFSILYERVAAKEISIRKILDEREPNTEKFLDGYPTIYKQLSGHEFTALSLSPVMKQGQVKARNKENGQNTLILGANCIATLYGYWEEYLRLEIGIAKGVLEKGATNNKASRDILNKHVVYDLWGDLRLLRHSILHKNGIATSEVGSCKIVKCFKPGDRVELDFEKMRAIFLLLAGFRNELDRLSRPPLKGIRIPSRTKC